MPGVSKRKIILGVPAVSKKKIILRVPGVSKRQIILYAGVCVQNVCAFVAPLHPPKKIPAYWPGK